MFLGDIIPFASSNKSSTFDKVYGCQRRPAITSLTARWIPSKQTAGVYEWTGQSDNKSKTMTFFGTGEMRGQLIFSQPSSAYTDAYLLAFAPKPTHQKYHHSPRIETPLFSSSSYHPTFSSTPSTLSKVFQCHRHQHFQNI
ncbi:unnamed protein product, partial [Didymodactylos carnosus]